VKVSSVCVARLHSGDVFVNEGGGIAACAEYGAICALGDELGGAGAAEGDGLQCACDVSEILVPCPACKCNILYPLFNGTSCKLITCSTKLKDNFPITFKIIHPNLVNGLTNTQS
jgi:hypothetical protein